MAERDNISSMQEARLYKALEGIDTRLTGIESQLVTIVRLEERVSNHEKTLGRFGSRLEEQDDRVRNMELWQAHHKDIGNTAEFKEDIENLENAVKTLQSTSNISKGQKDIGKEILKWVVATLTTVLIWLLTRK